MSSSDSDSRQIVRDRIALDRKIQLRFDKFQDFLTEVAGNISPGGMFVRSDEPQAAGDRFEFECSLADGYPLVSGRAEVVWIRERADSEAGPSGMGVRFLELRDKSEMLIRRIVEQRLRDGKRTFELDNERPQPKQATDKETAPLEVKESPSSPSPAEPSAPEPTTPGRLETSGTSSEPPSKLRPGAGTTSAEVQPERPKVPAGPTSAVISAGPSPPPAREASASKKSEPAASSPKATAPTRMTSSLPGRAQATPASASKPPEGARPSGSVPSAAAPSSARGADSGTRNRPATAPRAPAVGSSPSRPRTRLGALRVVELLLFSIVVGAFVVLAFHQYWVRPRIEGLEARLDELTGNSRVGGAPGFARGRDEPRAPTGQQDEATEAQPEIPVPEVVSSEPELVAPARSATVQETVQGWAKAWSEQRVEDYLAYYAPDFVPAFGDSRGEWQDRRRERLGAQGTIRVAVVSLQVEEISASEAQVTFTQSYQSNRFRDRVRKNLRLVHTGDGWKIAEEVVIRQLPW